MYDIMPYYMTKLMIDMPLMILTPLLMETICFWAVGFKKGPVTYFSMFLTFELVV